MKKVYSTPSLRVHGSLEALTQGTNGGSKLDRNFSVGTDVSDLTFS